MATFLSLEKVAIQLPRLAVLWTWQLQMTTFLTVFLDANAQHSGLKVESYTELQLIRVLFEIQIQLNDICPSNICPEK